MAAQAHVESRKAFGLPISPPDDPTGISCTICVNQCKIGEGQSGYCGLRTNQGGRLKGVSAKRGKLSWYVDPLPTNCVADWICAGGTGAGYPRFAHSPGAETGYNNLAVFFQACSFNCLFCQNWHFREETLAAPTRSSAELAAAVDNSTACICYFGGDPSPQLPYSLQASGKALEQNRDRILRVCWETNGSMRADLLDEMMVLAIDSGGCIKFDLKACNDDLHMALTGVTNARTLSNFERAAKWTDRRRRPPLLVASTLLVPGYIDELEVGAIAEFIAHLDPQIPYSLLGFHPQFYMADLPVTSRGLAQRCYHAAKAAGLHHVRIGNEQLLG